MTVTLIHGHGFALAHVVFNHTDNQGHFLRVYNGLAEPLRQVNVKRIQPR